MRPANVLTPRTLAFPFRAQARLQQAILSDYQAAMAHSGMQPYISHEQQWALVSKFAPEAYR